MTAEEKAMEYTDNEFAILQKSMAKEDMRHRAQKDFEAGYNEAMQCQSSPKIKQLEWIGSEGGNVITGIAIYAGYYRITSTSEGAWMRIATAGIRKRFETVDEAKAAAQADFEKRVMECLE